MWLGVCFGRTLDHAGALKYSNDRPVFIVSRKSAQAHPGVHARMLRDGWDRRPGMRIILGRWCGPPQLALHSSIPLPSGVCSHSKHTITLCVCPLQALPPHGAAEAETSTAQTKLHGGTGRRRSGSWAGSLMASFSTPTRSTMRTCGAQPLPGLSNYRAGCPQINCCMQACVCTLQHTKLSLRAVILLQPFISFCASSHG